MISIEHIVSYSFTIIISTMAWDQMKTKKIKDRHLQHFPQTRQLSQHCMSECLYIRIITYCMHVYTKQLNTFHMSVHACLQRAT